MGEMTVCCFGGEAPLLLEEDAATYNCLIYIPCIQLLLYAPTKKKTRLMTTQRTMTHAKKKDFLLWCFQKHLLLYWIDCLSFSLSPISDEWDFQNPTAVLPNDIVCMLSQSLSLFGEMLGIQLNRKGWLGFGKSYLLGVKHLKKIVGDEE